MELTDEDWTKINEAIDNNRGVAIYSAVYLAGLRAGLERAAKKAEQLYRDTGDWPYADVLIRALEE